MSGAKNLTPDPLLALLRERAREADMGLSTFVRDRFGTGTARGIWRWQSGERVTRLVADRICIALGVHPTSLWPDTQTPFDRSMPVQRPESFVDAACKGVDPGIFFPDIATDTGPAQAYCFTCPHWDDCYEFGLTQEWGIWAGTSEDERRAVRRQRGMTLPDLDDDNPLTNLGDTA